MNSSRPRFRLYVAVSLDGFIASVDGSIRWLEPYDPYDVDFTEFLSGIGSIVMGRRSHDQMLDFTAWPHGRKWPYEGKRTVVITRRPLREVTPDTETANEPLGDLADRLAAETTNGDIWVFGGGQIARTFLAAGRLDTIELCIVPHVVGDGIALFGPVVNQVDLRLISTRDYPKGLVRVNYEIIR
jgi:dihydrofolate reductase